LQTNGSGDTNWGLVMLTGTGGSFGGLAARVATGGNQGFAVIGTNDTFLLESYGASGNLWIAGKLTQAGCPADLKDNALEYLKNEAVKLDEPKTSDGKIICVCGKIGICVEHREKHRLTYFHNTGEQVMALTHQVLKQQELIDDLMERIIKDGL
jgi:hypothetical protein